MKRQGSKDPTQGELKAISRELRNFRKELQCLNMALTHTTRGALGPHKHARSNSRIAKNEKARALVISLYRHGYSYKEIEEQLRKLLNFSIGHSAVGRFVRALILEQLPESRLWQRWTL